MRPLVGQSSSKQVCCASAIRNTKIPDLCHNGNVVRLRIDLAYDGTDFHGWAKQPRLRTVQGELESSIDTILRLSPSQPGSDPGSSPGGSPGGNDDARSAPLTDDAHASTDASRQRTGADGRGNTVGQESTVGRESVVRRGDAVGRSSVSRRESAVSQGSVARRGVSVVVAGRTDSGVHAAHQVCHVDIDFATLSTCVGHLPLSPVDAFAHRLRHKLPADIALHRVSVAPSGFDARFSALERVYIYRICDDAASFNPVLRRHVLCMDDALDVEAMNEAVASAVGLHDFGSFATPNPGGTTIREVKSARWFTLPSAVRDEGLSPAQQEPLSVWRGMSECAAMAGQSHLVCFQIVADAFAHNMVRCLVNASIAVGLGKRSPAWFAGKVDTPLREGSTGPAPAHGLTLEHVEYPAPDLLAQRAQSIRAKRVLP